MAVYGGMMGSMRPGRAVVVVILSILAGPACVGDVLGGEIGVQGKDVILNFDNADVEVVIRAVSEIVGFNYVLAPDVRGKVTVQTSSPILQDQVFSVLLALLEVHGLTAVKSESLYKVIKTEEARWRAIPTIVGTASDPARLGDELITQIVPIRFLSVSDAATLLRPLMSPRGNVILRHEGNLLILTDSASNVRRLLEIIALADAEVSSRDIPTAQEVRELMSLLDLGSAARRRLFIYFPKFSRADALATTLNAVFGDAESRVRFIPHPGSNALIVILPERGSPKR